MKKFYAVFLACIISLVLNAQVTVTPPTPLPVSACAFPTAYSPLGNITITENAPTDVSGSGDFILTAPTNFEFQPGVGSVTTSVGDLSISGLSITATSITFTINVASTTSLDVITISGIQVRGINSASGPSNILRTGGTSVVFGDATSDAKNHGTLTSIQNPQPDIPVGTAGTAAGCTSFTANWNAAANATTYYIDVSTDPLFGSFVFGNSNRNAGNVTTLNITGLTAGTTYYYRVRANNACGTSTNSNVITYATLSLPPAPVADPGTGAACTQITANWEAATGATTYYIDVSTDPLFGSFVFGNSNRNAGNVTTLNITGLTAGTTYYYRVRANNACGTSTNSNVITYATLSIPPAPVADPGTGAACTQITANWEAATGATTYYIDVSTDPLFGSFVFGNSNRNAGNVTTLNITGLTAGTTYYYRVRANNACGTSTNSNVITYATLSLPPAPVADPGTGAACTQITANWEAATGATTYYIDVSTDPLFGSFVFGNSNRNAGNVTTLNITGLTAGTTYYYRVRANNACGTSISSNVITYSTLNVPAQPGTITGATSPCVGSSQAYNVTNVAGVSYSWTFPAGWTQTGGGTTNSITVTVGAGTGNITVTPSNACGSGTAQTLAVTNTSAPVAPIADPGNGATCTQITANWELATGATTYYIDVSADPLFGSFVFGYSNLNAGNVTTLNITGLTAGTTYYYRVRANNACGTSTNSNVITYATLSLPPAPVADPGTGAACTQITANWEAATGATTYYIDVSTDPLFGSFVFGNSNRNAGNVTTLNITGLTAGTTYYYRVRANNACGTSTNSNVITYATLSIPPAPVADPGTGAACTQITANWEAATGATTYYIDVSTDPLFGSFVFGNSNRNAGNVTTLNITGLTAGTTYYYRVRANNACGTSTNSNVITYATLSIPPAPVADPGTGAACTQITANWEAATGATTYYIDVSTDPLFGSFVFGNSNRNAGNVTTLNITGLTAGTTYYYRVRANNACGTSISSNVITYSTLNVPAQPGTITGATSPCVGSSQAYNVTNVAGVSYSWTFPAGWTQTGGGTTNSITVTVGAGTGNITVTPSNACGSGTAQNLAVTNTTVPAQPGTIAGATSPCVGSSQAYNVTNVAGVTYAWAFPAGWTQTGGGTTNAITVTVGAGTGNITVTPSNACGNGSAQTLAVTNTNVPVQPGTITGTASPCIGSSQTYNVTNVAGVTYAWTFPAGWTQTGGGTTNSITVTVGAGTGNITVTPSNACGIGTAQTLAVTNTTVPAQPGTITGATSPCVGSSQAYNVTNVAGVTYAWAFPAGWTQTGGGTTNSITVTVGAGTGNITVTPSNACGIGTAQTLAVTNTTVPAQPGTITGATSPCVGSSQAYNVTNVAGVAYAWTFPAGWTQTGGGTTNSITVTVGAGTGNITVTPSNACGNGTASTLAVTNTNVPSQPGTITGATSPCVGSSQAYNVTNVAGVAYAWTFPAGWTQTGGGTTNSITVTVGAGTGNITVTPSNACGNGTARTLAVTITNVPSQPGTITGAASPCVGSSQAYSVPNVAGVAYAWTFPSGWTQTGGGTTNSITVTVGATAGNISVTPSNACGNGTPQTLAVSPNPIPTVAPITGPTSVCTGATITLSDATSGGNWSTSNGSIATVNSSGVVTGVAAGTATITYTVSSGGCTASTTQAVTVTTSPSNIRVEFTEGANDKTWTWTIGNCSTEIGGGGQNDLDIYSGNPGGSATFQWQVSYDGGSTWSNAPGPTSTTTQYVLSPVYINLQTAGIYKFRLIITNNGCSGTSDILTLTVNAGTSNLTGGTVGSDQSFCSGSYNPAAFTQTVAPTGGSGGYTYQWQSSTDGVNWTVISGATGQTYDAPLLSQTTYFRRIVVAGYNCSAISNVITVRLGAPPTPGAITGPASVCPNTTQTYSIAAVSGATGYTWTVPAGWTINSGQGTVSINVTSGTTGQNGNISVTATNSCSPPNPASTLAVTVTAGPSTATVGANQNICGLTSGSLGGNTPGVGTGAWSIVSGGTGTFSNSSSGTSTFTANTYGTYLLAWTITSGSCSSQAQVTVIYSQAPTNATVGANQNICGSLVSGSLGGNAPSVGTGAWSIVSGGTGTFSNPANGNSTFTATAYGTYVLAWTITNGSCTASAANVTVSFSQAPTTATVGTTQNICGSLVSNALGGNTPIVGTGSWSIVSGGTGTFSNSTSGSSTFTGNAYGTYVLAWTITNGTCTSSANITVNFSQPPTTATVGVTQNICGTPRTSGSLGGNTPVIGTGAWSIVSGGTGTFSNATSGSSTFTANAYGTYVLAWTISNGSCTSSSASVTVNFYQIPTTASVGPTQNICGSLVSGSLGGNTPTTGTGAWSIVSGGTGTFSNASSGSSTFTANAYGTYVLAWTISNGTCASSSANVTVNYNQAPTTASVGANQNICASLVSGALGGNTPVVGTGAWSIVSGGTGTFSNPSSGSSTFTGNSYGTYVLAWTITNGTCTSAANVSINFSQTPTTATVGATQNRCGTLVSTSLGGNTPAVGTGLWSKTSGPGTVNFSGGGTSGSATATVSVTGTYVFTWTISNGSCPPSQASITVNYYLAPTISLSSAAGTDGQTLCANSLLTNITYAIGGGATGATVTGLPPGVSGNYNSGTYTISGTPTAGGTYNYTVTTTGPCTNVSANGTITVTPGPTGILSSSATTICAGTSVTFTAPAGYAAYTFYVNGTVAQGPNTSNIFSSSTLHNGDQVTVNVANAANCGATFGPITMTVNPLPTATLSPDNTTICQGDVIHFTAGGGTSYTFKVNGSSVQSGASNTYATLTSLAAGTYTVTVDVTDGNSCTATSAPVTITVNSLPTGTLTASPSTTICQGVDVTFTASGGYSIYEFKVDGTTVQGPSASNTYSTNSLANGQVVTVVATNTNTCSAPFPGILMNVNALPNGSITVTENSGTPNDNVICAGSPVTFTATAGFTNYAFYLNGTGAPLQTGSSNVYTSTTLTNGDYITVVVTNGNGCINTFPASAAITVNLLPAGTLTVSGNPACSGTTVIFTATSGFANYNFKLNNVTVQNGAGNTFTTTTLANGDVVTVDVTNNGCLTTFGPVNMVINALPTGTMIPVETSGLAANDGIICAGAPVVFTAPTGFTNYDFLLNGVTVQSGGSNTYTNSTLSNNDQVKVAVTNGSGCIALLNTINITVDPLPVVAAITGPTEVCVNSTITLSDATPSGAWSSSNNSIATIDGSGMVTGVAAGTVTITYSVTNANNCNTSVTYSVTVNALPVVAPITGTLTVCAGNTTQLSDATPSGTWSTSDASTASVDVNGLVTGVAAGTAIISYTVTNASGCTTVVTATVTVYPVPTVQPITGPIKVCVSSSITLSDATAGGTWSSSNTAVATINSSSGVVTGVSAGTSTITYAVTNGNGCTTSVTYTITVNALPVPTLSGQNPICPNTTETYTTEAGQFNYIWTFTGGTLVGGGTSTDNTITILWNQPGVRTIYVNYTDANGCSGATSATLTTSTGTVPTLSGTTPVCLNSDGTYTTQAGESAYTWTATGGTITGGGSPTDNTATVHWTTAGTGTVSINFTDGSGCTAASPTVYSVTVHNLPTATISGTASVCQNGSSPNVTFTGANGAAPYTFTYTINGGPTQTVTTTSGNSVTVSVPTGSTGNYVYALVGVSDNNGCSQTQSGSVTVTVNQLATGTISGTTAVCKGSAAPLVTFTGTNGTAPFTFKYTINGGATQTITTTVGNSVTVAAPTGVAGVFTYALVSVSDANGCLNPQAGSAIITVNPLPTATISGTTTVCLNAASPTITFTGAAGTSPYTFSYNINGGSTLTVTSVGNSATVVVPTNVAGTFAYNLLGVQDASTTACTQIQSGTATVIVDPTSVGGAVASNATVCSGSNTGTLTLSGQTGSVIRWESSTDGGVTWVPIVNTTTSLTYTNITQTTQYRTVVQSGVCSSTNSSPATITINPVSVGGTVAANQSICSGSTPANLTLGGNTGSVIKWQRATDAAFTTAVDIANTTTTLLGSAIGALTTTTYFRAVVQSGVCSTVNSAAATITVNPLPTVTAPAAICVGSTASLSPTSGGTWTSSNNGIATVTNAGVITGVSASPPTVTFTFTQTSTGCSNTTSAVTVNALPSAPIVTPISATICQGSIQPLIASSTGTSTGSVNLTNNTNYTIPDNSSTGVTSTINVTGIPAGAVINNMTVNFNIAESYDRDLIINLKAPNGNVLNLVNQKGGTGGNFTNTIVSSLGGSQFTTNSGAAPFTGTYSADAGNNVQGATSGGGNTSNVTSFSSLYGTPNGNWVFSAMDNNSEGYNGTIDNWTITINYTLAGTPQAVVWSPITDLYTDASATTAYTGQSLSTVYAEPSTSGTKVYKATVTNTNGCSSSSNVTLTVNPTPVVNVTADYCAVAGKVRLTATATPAGATFTWSTGQTGSTIDVDIADLYTVVASYGTGCSATGSIQVAQELVVNGDFESGGIAPNTVIGFTSDYAFKADTYATLGLQPPGQGILYLDTGNNAFSITPSGQDTHINFWGYDHTTGNGTGNFMAVNGHGNTLVVWKETVNVLPNTTYYFSAWAMSLNNVGPFAQLRFSVNDSLVGTTAVLASGVNSTTGNNGWTRFYGTWKSGPTTTTAQIYINDLQPSPGGNDFGLDDISFGTLSTFIQLESGPGTDAQTPCVNTAITPIQYSVGSTASGPTISGLPPGLTTSFNGVLFTISGTPTVPGNYTYTVTTTGSCLPTTATGTINVQAQTITLSSGSSAPTVCINGAVNIGYTLGGTATGATASGLPAGVNLSVAGNSVTISGAPTAAGSYPFTITTSGTCSPVTATGTITVQAQTITLNSGNNNQTVCINSPLTNITYTIAGTAIGASVSGLTGTGLTGTYNGGFFTISGTPTVSGTYNYTITTSGTCAAATATGTITVTPAAAIALSAGSNPLTVCKGLGVNIQYTITNATGASLTSGSLPAGVTGNFSGGVYTISGTPTAGGTFNYTVSTSGGCGIGSISGTITVQEETVSLTTGNASPSVCANSLMTDIVYTMGGTATSANVTGLPTGVTWSIAGNVITIGGTPDITASGPYNYSVVVTGTCATATATGTITVQPFPVGGTVSSVSICSGGSGSLTLSGNSNNPIRWEYSTNGGGGPWTPIANTTITQSYTNVTIPTLYRAVVGNGCGAVPSTSAQVGIHNYWTGAISNDWNTAANWSDNLVPSVICPDVYIPVQARQPAVTTGTPAIMNLHVLSGAVVTINGGTLNISGTITEADPNSIIAANGTINLNGSTAQTIPANTFLNNALNDLIISNTNPSGVTLGGALDIYESVTYGSGSSTLLSTGGNLTLKSSATQTASVGFMSGSNGLTGDVTVERYIATGNGHAKSWQLLAVPTTGNQTIKQAWQEGCGTNVDCHPGYGTQITSPAGIASGFDAASSAPSMKYYNFATDAYIGVSGTGIPIYNPLGYYLFVRGDRLATGVNSPASPTTLRTKGPLYTSSNLPPSSAVLANGFQSVGNPYASQIDMRKFILNGSVENSFIVWDPTLGGSYGVGAFQTITQIGSDYYAVPGNGSYYPGWPIKSNFIQSGQAFFIQGFPLAGGSISWNESVKAAGSTLLTTPNPVTAAPSMIRSSVYVVAAGGSPTILDGVLNAYGDTYSNAIDGLDARKIMNSGVNLGIRSGGKILAIERRHTIENQDTIFFNLTGLGVQNYRFHFDAQNLNPGLEAFLVDNYLNTRTAINISGGTDVNFNVVSIAGSYAANRFMIVFAPQKILPVTFTSIKAYLVNKNINVEWRVDNEFNMKEYDLEKSTDGLNFTQMAVQAPSANNGSSAVYVIADEHPVSGYNYYRVKSVDVNRAIAYSTIVKVQVGDLSQSITIYPNPITDGMIHLQLVNQPAGRYGLRLLNNLGQVIVKKQVNHAAGSSTELIQWNYNLAHGMYQLEVTRPDGSVKNLNVMY